MSDTWVRRIASFCVIFSMCALHMLPASAQNASVMVGVGDNILVVQGKTTPNSFVTISRDQGVIGTTSADVSGAFTQTFLAQEPGLHEISVVAQTPSGKQTDTITTSINIAEHATTTATFFLPSTLTIVNTNLAHNGTLQVSGETCPSCTVTLFIDNSDYAFATADSEGRWNIDMQVTALASGDHTLFVRVTDEFGALSFPTSPREFTVAAKPADAVQITPLVPSRNNRPSVPVITFPTPGAVWTSPTLIVRGTADRSVQIELFDGDKSLGSVWADLQGNWQLPIMLESRDYQLRVRACRGPICSALSDPLTFTARLKTGKAPVLRMSQTLFTSTPRQELSLHATVENGEPPYRVTIAWGDGITETPTRTTNGLELTHVYAEAGKYTGWIEVADKNGVSNRIYFSVNVTPVSTWPLIFLVILLAILSIGLLYAARRPLSRPETKKDRRK